jgi:hypothetical protein
LEVFTRWILRNIVGSTPAAQAEEERGLLSMAAAQPPAQLSIPNVRVFTGARVIDRATITVADGKILSPQQPTRLFQSLDHDDSEPILKTSVVNALPADGWRFSKPPPFPLANSEALRAQ